MTCYEQANINLKQSYFQLTISLNFMPVNNYKYFLILRLNHMYSATDMHILHGQLKWKTKQNSSGKNIY